MAKNRRFNAMRPQGFKPALWSNWQAYSEPSANLCKCCGEWAAELDKNEHCNEMKCRKKRQEEAIQTGRAIKFFDDIPGKGRVVIVRGEPKIF